MHAFLESEKDFFFCNNIVGDNKIRSYQTEISSYRLLLSYAHAPFTRLNRWPIPVCQCTQQLIPNNQLSFGSSSRAP